MTDTTSETSGLFGTGEFFLRDNYAPVTDELTEFDLPVEGAIPAELDGWYLRNGPNPRQAPKHWFAGDGMIHGVRIEGVAPPGTATAGSGPRVSRRASRSTTPTAPATCTRASPTPTWSTMPARRWLWSRPRFRMRSRTI